MKTGGGGGIIIIGGAGGNADWQQDGVHAGAHACAQGEGHESVNVGGGAGGGGTGGPGSYRALSNHRAGFMIGGTGSKPIIGGGWQHCGEHAGAQPG